MLRVGVFLIAAMLAGCAGALSQQRDLESSDQQQGNAVSCSGYKSWPDCFRTAAKMCPSGYDVISQEENLVTQGRTLRYSCKK